MGGWVGGFMADRWAVGYQYIYCLPPAGGRIRSQGNYCLPPAGVLHSQTKVIKCAAYGVAIMNGQVGGFAKVDNRFGYEKWT